MSDDDERYSFGSISSHGKGIDEGEGEGDNEGEKDSEILSEDALYEGVTEKNKIPDNERTTPKYLTKFEKSRVLGARALQISKLNSIKFNFLKICTVKPFVQSPLCLVPSWNLKNLGRR